MDCVGDGEEGCCIICLDPYWSEMTAVLLCGHCYHIECIDKWLCMGGSCPICSKELVTGVGRQ
jgi:hypothetical protein